MTNLLPAFTGAPAVNTVYHVDLFTLCDAQANGSRLILKTLNTSKG